MARLVQFDFGSSPCRTSHNGDQASEHANRMG